MLGRELGGGGMSRSPGRGTPATSHRRRVRVRGCSCRSGSLAAGRVDQKKAGVSSKLGRYEVSPASPRGRTTTACNDKTRSATRGDHVERTKASFQLG